jgi:hypothetical protein
MSIRICLQFRYERTCVCCCAVNCPEIWSWMTFHRTAAHTGTFIPKLQTYTNAGFCEYGNEPSCFINWGEWLWSMDLVISYGAVYNLYGWKAHLNHLGMRLIKRWLIKDGHIVNFLKSRTQNKNKVSCSKVITSVENNYGIRQWHALGVVTPLMSAY